MYYMYVQLLFFTSCSFILVDIGDAGRHNDSGVLANSSFGQALEANALCIPEPSPMPGKRHAYLLHVIACFSKHVLLLWKELKIKYYHT